MQQTTSYQYNRCSTCPEFGNISLTTLLTTVRHWVRPELGNISWTTLLTTVLHWVRPELGNISWTTQLTTDRHWVPPLSQTNRGQPLPFSLYIFLSHILKSLSYTDQLINRSCDHNISMSSFSVFYLKALGLTWKEDVVTSKGRMIMAYFV